MREIKQNKTDAIGPRAKGCRWLLKGGKSKDVGAPLELPEGAELTPRF